MITRKNHTSLLAHLLILVSVFATLFMLTACTKRAHEVAQDQPITELRYQGTAGFVTLPELAEDLGYLGPLKLKYQGSVQGGPADLQALATGDVDFATAFNGAIVKLAVTTQNSPKSIVAVVGSYGSDKSTWACYCVLANSPIKTAKDLIGKKIAVNTLGAHYEFIAKAWLARQGLTPAEIKQVELVVLPPVNTEQALRAGQIDVAVLSTILRDKAFAQGGIRKLFGDTDVFGEFTAGNYVFTHEFVKAHPDVVKQFTAGVAKAIEWTKNNPPDVVRARLSQIIHKRGRQENDKLVPFWKSYGVVDLGGTITSQQFQPWIDQLVASGEIKPGQIKATDIYTNEYNPYAAAVKADKTKTDSSKTGETP